MPEIERVLKVFLCHASQDKPVVRELYQRLRSEGWIDTWLDEKKLLPGQDWRLNIEEAVETSDIVIICLSNNSVNKEGFIQKELRYAREIALEKLEHSIFLIPLRLDECSVPRGLRFYQWADYFGEEKDETYNDLLKSLRLRYDQLSKLEKEEHLRKELEKELEILKREIAEKEAREKEEKEFSEKSKRERAEHESIERRVLRFRCSQSGQIFFVGFSRDDRSQDFKILGTQEMPFQGFEEGQKYNSSHTWSKRKPDSYEEPDIDVDDKYFFEDNAPPLNADFEADVFDFTGWNCPYCGHARIGDFPAFAKCSKCGELVCCSKTSLLPNGKMTFSCYPVCGHSGEVAGTIKSFKGIEPPKDPLLPSPPKMLPPSL